MARSRSSAEALRWRLVLLFFVFSIYFYFTSLDTDNSETGNKSRTHHRYSGSLFENVPRNDWPANSKTLELKQNGKDALVKQGWRKRIHWESKVDPHLYPYLLNPKRKCAVTHGADGDTLRNITLLILVKSAPGNLKRRDVVRRTYKRGVVEHDVSCKIVFLLGVSNDGDRDQKQKELVDESMTHGDILQEDFIDSYYNLTTKLIMGFKWASNFCTNSHFVMSTDDDVMIDITTLVDDLVKIPEEQRSNFALGQRTEGVSPYRDPIYKWYTPVEMWPSAVYPVYPQGHGYIISQDVSRRAYHTSIEAPIPLPWDDVYFGILLEKLGITLLDRRPWFLERHGTDDVRNGSASVAPAIDYLKIEMSIMSMDTVWQAIENGGRTN